VVPPTAELLRRFPDAQAIGLAGDARSRTPAWMDEKLPGLFGALAALGAPIVHYKTCSTFDSSPEVGSIGRAMEIGARSFGGIVPILVGAPHLGRYVAFGTLFASAGGEVHRIDRHPTMSRHPVTPMHEADLRRHLAAQTAMPIGLIGLDRLKAQQGGAALDAMTGEGAVLFDGVDAETLRAAGGLVWERAGRTIHFAVGSSGVTRALIEAWQDAGLVRAAPPAATVAPVDRLLVVSGSCSPVTAGQIERALAGGYAGVRADVSALMGGSAAEHSRIEAAALAALGEGRNAVIYSATGPLDAGSEASGSGLGAALGRITRNIVARGGPRRILFAGGDTSSHAVAELGLFALTWAGATERGAPLCRTHAENAPFDGLELVLKGGQIGSPDFFETVRHGDRRA
jgi:3-oxoisoapionate kinase